MKQRKIARRLFGLISLSLIILFSLQLIFQSLFLEKYYIHSKKQKIASELLNLSRSLENKTTKELNDELLRFSQEIEGATAVMDLNGKALYGLDTQRIFMDIKTRENIIYRIYLDSFLLSEQDLAHLKAGNKVSVTGIESSSENYYEVYPIDIQVKTKDETYSIGGSQRVLDSRLELATDTEAVGQHNIVIDKKLSTSMSAESSYVYPSRVISNLEGDIEQVYLPSEKTYGNGYREYKILEETSNFLIDTINSQRGLEVYKPIIYEKLDTYIGVNHIVGIVPMGIDDRPVLLVAMSSLQGVEEAVGIMNQYALLFFGGAMGVALLIAYGYAKKFTRPLVELRNITTDIANLDFSHSCRVTTQDEIGELADNINKMSERLKTNLETMQKDINLKSQLEEQRKQLIANVSHELKTPLTIMKGTCCGLKDGMYDVLEETHIEGMLGQIDQMSDLVQELLSVSRLETEVQLEEEVFVLSDTILKVHRHLKPLIREKNLKINLDLEEYMVQGNRKKIETVVRNLYNNAIFYTPEDERIDIQITKEEAHIKCNITNHGVSIPTEVQEQLWEPFYRIDQSGNKALGGSGLGLYMVQQILQKHESKFGVSSKENEVTFWFQLPYVVEV